MEFTDTYRQNQPDGSTLSLDYVYERRSPGSGFAGTWESTSEKVNSDLEFEIQPYGSDGLSFITPGEKAAQNIRFDGKDHPVAGSDVGMVSSWRRVNEHTLETTSKIGGKVVVTQHIELSPDLKTMTTTVHPAGQSKRSVTGFAGLGGVYLESGCLFSLWMSVSPNWCSRLQDSSRGSPCPLGYSC